MVQLNMSLKIDGNIICKKQTERYLELTFSQIITEE
jgi:hypothetical protein